MKRLKNKTLIASFIFAMIGIAFLIAENQFYQYIDSEGVLRESLFLPLGMLSIFIGIVLCAVFIIKKAWKAFANK